MSFLRRICQIKPHSSLLLARRMSKIYVKNTKGDESLQISFEFCYNGKGREFNAVRPKTESIENTFKRISQNIAKFFDKKSKRKRKQGEEDPDALNISMKVFGPDGNSSIALESTSEEALKHGNVVTISSEKYTVDVNPPYCHSILLPQIVMVGFPIYPKLDTEFCSLDDSVYVWEKVKYTEVAANNDNKSNQQELERTEVCRCLSYSAVNDDIGYKLALTVTPKCGDRLGKSVSSESKFEVTAGPGLCPFEERQKWTEKLTDYDELRVVSYNILADVYADQDFSRDVLFNYCPPYALSIDYRKHLIVKELQGYNADIVCLQECDTKVFDWDLTNVFSVLGFQGHLREKDGVREGSAIFFRKSKFRLIEEHGTVLREFLETDKSCEDLVKKTYNVAALKEVLETRSTILHVLALEPLHRPGQVLLVANTHLYFHPDCAHIRLVQTLTSLRFLEKLMHTYRKQKPTIIFCGDFNSTPEKGIYTLMTTKEITEHHADWTRGGEDQFAQGMNFTHNFSFASGCGLPAYTNFTNGFHGHLDYVYYDNGAFEVAQVVPPPDHRDVEFHTAIPSIVFPSDHIAQICDLKWKSVSHL